MTRTQAVCLTALVTLILGGVYFTRTGRAPAGQPKLVELKASSRSNLQAGFNRESGKLRVILLLSPTCPTCLAGASAVDDVLKRHPDGRIVVFAVWEPMLSTDWSEPGTGTLKRLSDSRVQQFWDADHTVAAALEVTEEATQLHPSCCKRRGVLWDLIAAYPACAVWSNTIPRPIFFDGTMVQSAAGLEGVINNVK
jgi:thiol-disulfide isomerase/thioredoxin